MTKGKLLQKPKSIRLLTKPPSIHRPSRPSAKNSLIAGIGVGRFVMDMAFAGCHAARHVRHGGQSKGIKHQRRLLPLFEIARVLMRLNQVACFIVNANHSIM
jgi:hypothetical protein